MIILYSPKIAKIPSMRTDRWKLNAHQQFIWYDVIHMAAFDCKFDIYSWILPFSFARVLLPRSNETKWLKISFKLFIFLCNVTIHDQIS